MNLTQMTIISTTVGRNPLEEMADRRVPAELGQESQASSRGDAKDSALLSSRDAGLLEPPE